MCSSETPADPHPSLSQRVCRVYHPKRIGWAILGVSLCFSPIPLVAMSGCGASYQSIYEGEVRFEHCYRLDEEPGIPLTQRRECWREWTKFYTYGQTRDRLEYALRRQRELTTQVENPGAAITNGEGGTGPSEPLAAPPPTSPFVAPPHVHDDRQDGGPDGGGKKIGTGELIDMFSSGEHPPNQQCVLQCLAGWHKCVEGCGEKGVENCRVECDHAFRSCGGGCFK